MPEPPNVAVVWETATRKPLRVYVNEDHEDGAHMHTIKPGDGESVGVIPKEQIRGLSLLEVAEAVISKAG